jgi:oxygen-dependent protoporphyrinogen oxidase
VTLDAQVAQPGGVPVEVTLLESDNRLGGKVQSDRVGRLLLERGPDAMFVRTPAVLDTLHRFVVKGDLVTPDPRHRQSYVLRDGDLHALPDGMQTGVPRALTPLVLTRLLTPWGKLRAAAEAVVPARDVNDDESVDSFVRRRFGAEVAERIAAPLLGGIYSSDIRRLSLLATAPYLRQTERDYGSLLRASLAQREHRLANAASRPASPFVSLRAGMDNLPRAMRSRLPATRVRVRTPLLGITRRGTSGLTLLLPEGEKLEVDRLVLAVPASVAGPLLAPLVPEAADRLSHVRYASVIVAALAFPAAVRASAPEGSGFVVAPDQARLLAACSWSSNKWPHTAPDGELLIRCHLHVENQPELLDASNRIIIEEVRRELQRTIGLSATPLVTQVFRWPDSIPSYSVGHLRRMAELDRALAAELPGVVLAGAAYRGVGVPDCIRQGEEAAARILSHAEVCLS